MAVKDTGKISRGYKSFRQIASKDKGMLRRIRSCKTCTFFYGKPEEICNNGSVTSYDMTKDPDGREYCSFWRPEGVKQEDY